MAENTGTEKISIACPSCGQKLKIVPQEKRMRVHCPKCNVVFMHDGRKKPEPEVKPIQPKQKTPVQPKQKTPIQPKQTTPVQPKQKTPEQPKQVTPVQPKQTTPVQPKQTTPVQPKQVTSVQPQKDGGLLGKVQSELPKSRKVAIQRYGHAMKNLTNLMQDKARLYLQVGDDEKIPLLENKWSEIWITEAETYIKVVNWAGRQISGYTIPAGKENYEGVAFLPKGLLPTVEGGVIPPEHPQIKELKQALLQCFNSYEVQDAIANRRNLWRGVKLHFDLDGVRFEWLDDCSNRGGLMKWATDFAFNGEKSVYINFSYADMGVTLPEGHDCYGLTSYLDMEGAYWLVADLPSGYRVKTAQWTGKSGTTREEARVIGY